MMGTEVVLEGTWSHGQHLACLWAEGHVADGRYSAQIWVRRNHGLYYPVTTDFDHERTPLWRVLLAVRAGSVMLDIGGQLPADPWTANITAYRCVRRTDDQRPLFHLELLDGPPPWALKHVAWGMLQKANPYDDNALSQPRLAILGQIGVRHPPGPAAKMRQRDRQRQVVS